MILPLNMIFLENFFLD
jgi:hypothetical protein